MWSKVQNYDMGLEHFWAVFQQDWPTLIACLDTPGVFYSSVGSATRLIINAPVNYVSCLLIILLFHYR